MLQGLLEITVTGGSLLTKRDTSSGVHAVRGDYREVDYDVEQDININVRGVDIDTFGKHSNGILGFSRYQPKSPLRPTRGNIRIAVTGGSINTNNDGADGINGFNDGSRDRGDITIDVTGEATVTTHGSGAHGLYARHISGMGKIDLGIGAGSSITANGANASGVQVGGFDSTTNAMDAMKWMADFGDDGFRRQTVHVNGSVMGGSGEAAGIYLVGGGKVVIGPQGTVGAKSGISIHAARKDPTNPAPALYLELDPGGRTMAEVLRGGWILNDGKDNCNPANQGECGGTTIFMNGVKLHDRLTGATGLWAPNGAWDVRLRKQGRTFEDAPTEKPIIDNRDFSAADFISRFTARGTVYEALPRFLFRIDGLGSAFEERRPRADGRSNWFRFSGLSDAFDAKTATVSTRYDYDRLATETGRTFRLGGGVSATLGMRAVSGSANARSSAGRGELEAFGRGLSAGLEWSDGAGTRIAAGAAATRYELDLETPAHGTLVDGVSATVRSFRLEAGRSLGGGNRNELLGWIRGAQVSVDGFADSRNSNLPAIREGFLVAGASVAGETELDASGGNGVVLRGSLGFERMLDGDRTAVPVTATVLRSSAPANRVLLDLEAVHPLGNSGSVTIGLGVRGIGSGDPHIAASGDVRFRF